MSPSLEAFLFTYLVCFLSDLVFRRFEAREFRRRVGTIETRLDRLRKVEPDRPTYPILSERLAAVERIVESLWQDKQARVDHAMSDFYHKTLKYPLLKPETRKGPPPCNSEVS